MFGLLQFVYAHPYLSPVIGAALFYFLGSFRYIPNTRVGIVEKRIAVKAL